jgi:hypothetical protein
MCAFLLSKTLSKTFLILRRSERDMIKKRYWSPCNYPLFLSDFNENLIFFRDFRKIRKYKISRKSPIESRVVLCGRTDRHDEANSRFSQFCERA